MEVKTSLVHLGKLKMTEDYQIAILWYLSMDSMFFHNYTLLPRNKPKFQIKVITQDI